METTLEDLNQSPTEDIDSDFIRDFAQRFGFRDNGTWYTRISGIDERQLKVLKNKRIIRFLGFGYTLRRMGFQRHFSYADIRSHYYQINRSMIH